MDLRQTIFKLCSAKDYIPLRREEIIAVLKLNPDEIKKAHSLFDQMLERGEIARLKKDKLCIPEDADLVSGRILFRQSGVATIIPDSKPSTPVAEGHPVSSEDTGVAMHGDQVLARKLEKPRRPFKGKGRAPQYDPKEKPKLRVIRILKRAREIIPGTLERGRHASFVIPDDPRITQDILVPDPANCGILPVPKVGGQSHRKNAGMDSAPPKP